MPGDDLVPNADVEMDRRFRLAAPVESVWPWFVQLGKSRAGWYLPRAVELAVPRQRRATRRLEPRWQELKLGDVIPDWGGKKATFEVALMQAPTTLVYRSQRGRTSLSWAIELFPADAHSTEVHLRLRLAPVKHKWLAANAGGFFDWLTVVGLAAGLRERLNDL
jgi:hypothetical protein